MRIDKCNSLKLADAFLSLIRLEVEDEDNPFDFSVQCYANGREQGYCIEHYPFKAVFAQCRRSDRIFVCYDYKGLFSLEGNVPGDEAFKYQSKYFDADEIVNAVKWLAHKMEQFMMDHAGVRQL